MTAGGNDCMLGTLCSLMACSIDEQIDDSLLQELACFCISCSAVD